MALPYESVTITNKAIITGPVFSKITAEKTSSDIKKIRLIHYPSTVKLLAPKSYDLILAGHTHGGQVYIPFIKNPILQKRDLAYRKGLFHTKAGPMYANPGIGTYYWPIRFLCRPEITIIKL